MSKRALEEVIDALEKKGKLPNFVAEIIRKFYNSYLEAAARNGYSAEEVTPLLQQLTHHAVHQISHPYRFEPYHKKVRSPFDYYALGNDFIRPLIDLSHSEVFGLDHLEKAVKQVKKGENVIFFANHQIEPDPQVISILLENLYPEFGEEMIFVAGHRVVTDPLAVPLSMGRNLLCIFSKKHIEHPPEQKAEKLVHNQKTMKKLEALLKEGGKAIYVAPSGGRDRPNEIGNIKPAPFDPQSVELFNLIAKQAETPTHFYPLALATYYILPPPNSVEKEIGERRHADFSPVFLAFGEEVDLDKVTSSVADKKEKRKMKAQVLWDHVNTLYQNLEVVFKKPRKKS